MIPGEVKPVGAIGLEGVGPVGVISLEGVKPVGITGLKRVGPIGVVELEGAEPEGAVGLEGVKLKDTISIVYRMPIEVVTVLALGVEARKGANSVRRLIIR